MNIVKKLKVFVFLITISMLFTHTSYAEKINIVLNGVVVSFDSPPQIVSGRVLVPFRGIFEHLGYKVVWDKENQIAEGSNELENKSIAFKIGVPYVLTAACDDMDNIIHAEIDVPPQIIQNRTMIPLRAMAEAIGADVQWNSSTKTVTINHKREYVLTSEDSIGPYLNNKYSHITIGNKEYKISYEVGPNLLGLFQYDIKIVPIIGNNNEVLLPITIPEFYDATREEKKEIVEAIKNHMKPLAKELIAAFPNTKILCQFDESFYTYPNIKIDFNTRTYFSWGNYEYDTSKKQKDTKPSSFRWIYEADTLGRLDFNDYFDKTIIETPAYIEDSVSPLVVHELKYVEHSTLDYEGEKAYVTFEATVGGNGHAYLNMYDDNGKLLGSSIIYFYNGTKEYEDYWPIGTKKITITEDEDMSYEKNEIISYSSDLPYEISECSLIEEDSVGYSFVIDADVGLFGEYVYINCFDKNDRFLGYAFQKLNSGREIYYIDYINVPKGIAHIVFSEDKVLKIED